MLDPQAAPSRAGRRAKPPQARRRRGAGGGLRPVRLRPRSGRGSARVEPAAVRAVRDARAGVRHALGALASRPDRGRARSIRCCSTGTWSRSSAFPAILVHSKPLDPPELAEALACGASSLVSADRIEDHFLSVLRMVGQGYLVVDSMPMRPLIGAVRARWDEQAPGGIELPELTARESDILRSRCAGTRSGRPPGCSGSRRRPSRTCRPACSASSACATGRGPLAVADRVRPAARRHAAGRSPQGFHVP